MIPKDIEYWKNTQPPLCPNEYEIEIYKHHCKGYGPICLLGMTKQLQFLCDFMVDAYPEHQTKPVIKRDWKDLNEYAEVIIGDGVVNLEGLELINTLREKYKKIICRVFLNKFSWMKYAKHFPTEFPGSKLTVPTQKDIAIIIWD
jgi:hypothetical protein